MKHDFIFLLYVSAVYETEHVQDPDHKLTIFIVLVGNKK